MQYKKAQFQYSIPNTQYGILIMMFDLIAIGNISADLYFSADELTKKGDRLSLAIGGKYRAEEFRMSVGGGGANVSIGGRKNGLRTAVVGMVGNNVFRKGIMHRLQTAKVNTSHVMFSQGAANVSVLLLQNSGERTVIAHQSSHQHILEEAHVFSRKFKTRAVYFGNLPHVSVKERRSLMKALKAKDIDIFVNIGPLDCCKPKTYINELLENVDVLILNTHEFGDLVKKDLPKINFRTSVLEMLPVMKDKVLIITDGKNGSYGYEAKKVFHCPIVKGKTIVDTTGVGDGYTAGFIASYLQYSDVLRAMKVGSRYASKLISRIGAN